MIIVPTVTYAGGHSDTGPLEPLLRVAYVQVLQGENWAISLLTLTLKIQSKSLHTTSKPTSILLQDASSPRQQAKQCIRLLMSSYCTIKTNKSKRVACRHQQFRSRATNEVMWWKLEPTTGFFSMQYILVVSLYAEQIERFLEDRGPSNIMVGRMI